MFDLKGRVALVTGSTTGLGKAMAFHLGRAGAKVALNFANNELRAAKALEEFREEGLEGAEAAAGPGCYLDVLAACGVAGAFVPDLDVPQVLARFHAMRANGLKAAAESARDARARAPA